MKRTFLFAVIALLASPRLQSQSTDEIVAKIAEINEVQYKQIGDKSPGSVSPNYENFEALKESADQSTLLKLIRHQSLAVSCYASWALIDIGYDKLPTIFDYYSRKRERVWTYGGTLKSFDPPGEIFYFRCLNSGISQKTRITLDSIALHAKMLNPRIVRAIFASPPLPDSFNKRIAYMAFEMSLLDATLYLSNWFAATYESEIKSSLTKHFRALDMSREEPHAYYKLVSALLKFNDPDLNDLIVEKFESHNGWLTNKEAFLFLLESHNVYVIVE